MVRPINLIADDLTGALDSAAALLPAAGPLRVRWHPGWHDLDAHAVFSTETREQSAEVARQRVLMAARLMSSGADLFKKVDSMMRGHVVGEIAACLHAGRFDRVIIAPSFPEQGRVTIKGVQYWPGTAEGVMAGSCDLHTMLSAAGLPATLVPAGGTLSCGICICDAQDDSHLDMIVAQGFARQGRTLWCGTAGLASAIGRTSDGKSAHRARPPGNVLGLIGTHHPVMHDQLERLQAARPSALHWIGEDTPWALAAAAAVANDRLAHADPIVLAFGLPPLPDASARIAGAIQTLISAIERPNSIMVSGGETCRLLCSGLSCNELELLGTWRPGVPCSRMQGGRWHGLSLFSKSGAFGKSHTLLEFLDDNGAPR